MDSLEAKLLSTVKQTQLEMIQDRWYDLEDDVVYFEKVPNTRKELNNEYVGVAIDANDKLVTKRIKVHYLEKSEKNSESSLVGAVAVEVAELAEGKRTLEAKGPSKSFVKTFVKANSDLFEWDGQYPEPISHYTSLLIISKTPLNPPSNKALNAARHWVRIDVILDESLLYNLTKHVFVPKHRLIPKKKAIEICKTIDAVESGGSYAVGLEQMRIDDPVAVYYEANVGDLFKITRDDGYIPMPNPKSVAYRVVVGASIKT